MLKAYQEHLISAFGRKRHCGGKWWIISWLTVKIASKTKFEEFLKCQSDKYTEITFSLNFSMLIYSPFSSHRSIACLVFICCLIRFRLLRVHRRKSKIAKLVWQNRRGIQYSCARVWSFIPCQIFFLSTCTD